MELIDDTLASKADRIIGRGEGRMGEELHNIGTETGIVKESTTDLTMAVVVDSVVMEKGGTIFINSIKSGSTIMNLV